MTHTVTQDFREEYEAERTRWLRRRILWYTGILGGFQIVSLAISFLEIALGSDRTVSLEGLGLIVLRGFPVLLLLLGSFAYVSRRTMRQESLLRIAFWLTVIIGAINIAFAPAFREVVIEGGAGTLSEEATVWARRLSALGVLFFTHFVACLFIPWTAREASRPLLPLLGVLALTTLILGGGLVGTLVFLGLSPFAGLPGVAVCWWRHSRFRDRFLYRMVRGRYGELQRELIDARSVHEALFPEPILEGDPCFHFRYEPMHQIGGDYLYAFREKREDAPDRLSVILIDVTGHGIKAALTVNRVYGELERVFAETPDIEPGPLLLALNRYVRLTLAKHNIYATALVMRFDPQRDELTYANAGHPPAFLRTAGGLIEQLDSTAPLLGVFERRVYHPDPRTIRFGPGDTLIAYTDGATDSTNETGDRLKIVGLQRILAGDKPESLKKGRWAATIAHEINHFRFGAAVDDTLLVEVWRPIHADVEPHRRSAAKASAVK